KELLILDLTDVQDDDASIRFASQWIVETMIHLPVEENYDAGFGLLVSNYFLDLMRSLQGFQIPQVRGRLAELKLFIARQVDRLVAEFPIDPGQNRETDAIYNLAYDFYRWIWQPLPSLHESEEFDSIGVDILKTVATRSYGRSIERFQFLKSFLGHIKVSESVTSVV